MSIEVRPLFRLEVVRPQIRAAELPPLAGDVLARLQNWSELINSGKIDRQKETQILPDFLTDLFGGVLGYTLPAAATDGRYTLQRESFITPGTEYADAALGRFQTDKAGGEDQTIAVVEGKGPKDPLDRPYGGRRLSAVD